MKDEKGHGSNSRGGSSREASEAYLVKMRADRQAIQRFSNRVAEGMNPMNAHNALQVELHGGGSAAPSNTAAASELASGAKSATVPVHDSMGTPRPSDNIQAVAAHRDYGSGGIPPSKRARYLMSTIPLDRRR